MGLASHRITAAHHSTAAAAAARHIRPTACTYCVHTYKHGQRCVRRTQTHSYDPIRHPGASSSSAPAPAAATNAHRISPHPLHPDYPPRHRTGRILVHRISIHTSSLSSIPPLQPSPSPSLSHPVPTLIRLPRTTTRPALSSTTHYPPHHSTFLRLQHNPPSYSKPLRPTRPSQPGISLAQSHSSPSHLTPRANPVFAARKRIHGASGTPEARALPCPRATRRNARVHLSRAGCTKYIIVVGREREGPGRGWEMGSEAGDLVW